MNNMRFSSLQAREAAAKLYDAMEDFLDGSGAIDWSSSFKTTDFMVQFVVNIASCDNEMPLILRVEAFTLPDEDFGRLDAVWSKASKSGHVIYGPGISTWKRMCRTHLGWERLQLYLFNSITTYWGAQLEGVQAFERWAWLAEVHQILLRKTLDSVSRLVLSFIYSGP
jgi:hypothetical protein